ncbi:MAG: hypothetical protein ACLRX3_07980 [Subdoligranulum sp.]
MPRLNAMRGTQFIPAEVQETPFHRIPWQGIGLRQHRTIPALRLKHRSGSCGTASALPKCSIMSGCGTRIVLRGQKPLALCDRRPCFGSLFPPLAALTFAEIQYYLRFWLGICRTSLAVSALRIMRYCLNTPQLLLKGNHLL